MQPRGDWYLQAEMLALLLNGAREQPAPHQWPAFEQHAALVPRPNLTPFSPPDQLSIGGDYVFILAYLPCFFPQAEPKRGLAIRPV